MEIITSNEYFRSYRIGSIFTYHIKYTKTKREYIKFRKTEGNIFFTRTYIGIRIERKNKKW